MTTKVISHEELKELIGEYVFKKHPEAENITYQFIAKQNRDKVEFTVEYTYERT